MEPYAVSPTNLGNYEVVRQAIIGRNADALADVVAQYRPLLIVWARQKLARLPIDDSCDDIADEAFARAWFALVSSGLDKFPNLATILGYLRRCVESVVVDHLRAQRSSERIQMRMEITQHPSPEQTVLADLNSAEIWSRISQHVVTEQERVVVYESMILSLPPRIILQRHQELFEDVAEIYRIKRNLFDRLRRDDDLRQLYQA